MSAPERSGGEATGRPGPGDGADGSPGGADGSPGGADGSPGGADGSPGGAGGEGGDGARILAVDDEPRALADLARLLREHPGVAEVRCAADAGSALRHAADVRFDAVFLDLRMPGLDGLELARVLRRFADPPAIVFVSAHDDGAVDAFELHALDYLRKPVARPRAAEAVARVLAARDSAPAPAPTAGSGGEVLPPPPEDDVVAVSALTGGATRLLRRADIRYASSHGDFVRIVTADGRFLLRATLADVERRWGTHGFMRVHRQYVVNLHQAVELRPQLGGTGELAFADGTTVPVARRHAGDLARRVGARG